MHNAVAGAFAFGVYENVYENVCVCMRILALRALPTAARRRRPPNRGWFGLNRVSFGGRENERRAL